MLFQRLDRVHFVAFGLPGEHQAAARAMSVHQHGTSAADAMLAAQVRAGQAQFVAQAVRQGACAVPTMARPFLAVDMKHDAVQRAFIVYSWHAPMRSGGARQGVFHGAHAAGGRPGAGDTRRDRADLPGPRHWHALFGRGAPVHRGVRCTSTSSRSAPARRTGRRHTPPRASAARASPARRIPFHQGRAQDATAKSPWRRAYSTKCQPCPGRQGRIRISVTSSSGARQVDIRPSRTRRRPPRGGRARRGPPSGHPAARTWWAISGGWIHMAHAAADGAAVAGLPVTDVQDGGAQDCGRRSAISARKLQVPLARHRSRWRFRFLPPPREYRLRLIERH